MEFQGHRGTMHFGYSEGKGGLKYGSRSWYGMDIFCNHPYVRSRISKEKMEGL